MTVRFLSTDEVLAIHEALVARFGGAGGVRDPGLLQRRTERGPAGRFKGKAKAFLRTYAFLAAILPYTNAGWEKLSVFLNFLVPKLPAPVEEDLAKGILAAIELDSYRVGKLAAVKMQLPDATAGPRVHSVRRSTGTFGVLLG